MNPQILKINLTEVKMKNLANWSQTNLSERVGGLISKEIDRANEADDEKNNRRQLTIEVKPLIQNHESVNQLGTDEEKNSTSLIEKNIQSFKTSPKALNSDIK